MLGAVDKRSLEAATSLEASLFLVGIFTTNFAEQFLSDSSKMISEELGLKFVLVPPVRIILSVQGREQLVSKLLTVVLSNTPDPYLSESKGESLIFNRISPG